MSSKSSINIIFIMSIAPLNRQWKVDFILDGERDVPLALLHFANDFFPLKGTDFIHRRLAIHEAVNNALFYGKKPTLTAWGKRKFLYVNICQENEISWPKKLTPYQGIVLIQRYAKKIKLSPDKKKLHLFFY